MGFARKFAFFTALFVGVYAVAVRPRLVRWGATDEEVRQPYPGVDLIPGGTRSGTMAITIDAPPSKVWPWLVQMGYGRAGWYSWDHLDNWGRSSADMLHPEWQEIAIGDHLPSMPDEMAWWEVAALEPERFLGLRASMDLNGQPFDPKGPRPRYFTDSLWGFLLDAGWADAARGQWLLGSSTSMAATDPEFRLPRTVTLDHADPAVHET